jgi:hypothetical protein
MNPKILQWMSKLPALLTLAVIATAAQAQTTAASLSGTITGPSGAAVGNARVSVRNTLTGQTAQTETNSAGAYNLSGLAAGDYEASVTAEGFDGEQSKVTLKAGANQTLNLTLTSALSLQGLGFPSAATQGNAQEQARLNKRSHMLKVHQKLGLITTIPLVATVVSGSFAGGKSTSSSTRDLHAALGSATAGLYFTTAYYAIFAPKVPGTKVEGPIRVHKALAWIHGPGMILTPILGAMAFNQKSQGETVHGIASIHGEVAIVTAVAYGLAILSVSKPGLISKSTHAFLGAFGLHHSGPQETGTTGPITGSP